MSENNAENGLIGKQVWQTIKKGNETNERQDGAKDREEEDMVMTLRKLQK